MITVLLECITGNVVGGDCLCAWMLIILSYYGNVKCHWFLRIVAYFEVLICTDNIWSFWNRTFMLIWFCMNQLIISSVRLEMDATLQPSQNENSVTAQMYSFLCNKNPVTLGIISILPKLHFRVQVHCTSVLHISQFRNAATLLWFWNYQNSTVAKLRIVLYKSLLMYSLSTPELRLMQCTSQNYCAGTASIAVHM